MPTTTLRILVATAVILAGIAATEAHSVLSQAVPSVGGVVSAPPQEIRLTFSDAIEPAFSRIQLTTADGKPIGTGAATVDPRNNRQLVLPIPRLAPGRYRVWWHVVSADTHTLKGDYVFEIRP